MCRASPLALYLSAGLTMARLSVSGGLRGAYCQQFSGQVSLQIALPRTRMLGVSVFSPAISFARSALVEKARAAVERAAVANGRLTASLSAIACVVGRAELRGAAGRGGQWGGEGGCDTDVLQARSPANAGRSSASRPSGWADSLLQAHLPPARSPIVPRSANTVHLFP